MPLLAHARITANEAHAPSKWLVFLHGILGSGANWRTFAKQIVAERPEHGALLVDLRLHGESRDFEPPHTLAAAGSDLAALLREPDYASAELSVLGHSFGGKVAIELAGQLAREGRRLRHLFVVDSTPGARPDARGSSGVRDIVELLTGLPPDFPDRNAFTAWIEERGVSRPVAMWLAMNVRPVTGPSGTTRFVFRIDVASVRAMMEDYFLRDLWPVLESPREGMETHLVAGGRSQVLDDADRERGRRLPSATVDVIPDAGHWVHVDAPDALRAIVLRHL